MKNRGGIVFLERTDRLFRLMQQKTSIFLLILVAALWGLTFPLITQSMKTQDPFLFVSIRFTLAAIPILPYFLKRVNREILVGGILLGIIHCGAFLTQTIGLQTVDSSRAAFLTSMYVLLIPMMAPLFRMGRPGKHDFVSACICCFGVYVLMGCDLGTMTMGDGWIIAGAVCIAVSIIYIGLLAQKLSDPYMLAYTQIVMTGLFSWVPCFVFGHFALQPYISLEAIGILSVCSFLCTVLAIALQSKHQKFVSVQSAALIFSLEPVFAALFDSVFSASLPTIPTLVGGGLILFSVMYLEVVKARLVKRSAS